MAIKVEVINWALYNPRTDSKRPTWFRVDNDFATGPGFFEFDCEQKWLWVVILSLVSQKNGQPITWSSAYIESITGIKEKKQLQTIEKFEQFSRLRVSRDITSSNISNLPATNERDVRTNETNETDSTAQVALPVAVALHHVDLAPIGNILLDRKIKPDLTKTWLFAFPEPEWIIQEVQKAIAWEAANPRKQKKDFGKFMTNWLNRGWDSRKVPTNFNRAEQRTANNRVAAETYMRKLENEK